MNNNFKICKYCNEEIPRDAIFCTNCGSKLVSRNYPSNNKQNARSKQRVRLEGVRYCNKWVSLLLCLFLGMFGAHKFYEGKIISGIAYMLTSGLFGIGWIIDILKILEKPNNPYVVS